MADTLLMEENALESLEQRLSRLEAALASLQDTRDIEERVVERVSKRFQTPAAAPGAKVETAIVERSRHPLTVLTDLLPKREARPESEPPPAAVPVARAVEASPALAFGVSQDTVQQAWFLVDVWGELRSVVRMFFDVRYAVGWWTRMTVFVLLPLILLSNWWVPFASIPIFGAILDRAVGLVLAFFLFKTLTREAVRYRAYRARVYG